MHRHRKAPLAVLVALVLCAGTCGVTMAVASEGGSSIPSTQSIRACSTADGLLRLASKGRCPAKTSGVSLARPALESKALSVLFTATSGSKSSSLSLFGGSSLKATCQVTADGEHEAYLAIHAVGQTRIDGTSFSVRNGDAESSFEPNTGPSTSLSTGAATVYETGDGAFQAGAFNGYATTNLHFLITVPRAVFIVTSIIEDNVGSGYCRITAEVESAVT